MILRMHPNPSFLMVWAVLALPSGLPAVDVESPDAAEVRIARGMDRLLDEDSSTAGMVQAAAWEFREWDQLMNTAYQALLSNLPTEEQATLRASQRAWLAYRDAELTALRTLFEQKEGTMFIPMAARASARVVKHRAIELATLVQIWRIDVE